MVATHVPQLLRQRRTIAGGERAASTRAIKGGFQFGELLHRRIAAWEAVLGHAVEGKRLKSSKKPLSCAATALWWLRNASSSWASREMLRLLAMSSVCSPMLRPATGFLTCGTKESDIGRAKLSQKPQPLRQASRAGDAAQPTERFCPSPTWTRLMLSTPPTIARDGPPARSIPAASNTPTMLVLHCMTVVKVGHADRAWR